MRAGTPEKGAGGLELGERVLEGPLAWSSGIKDMWGGSKGVGDEQPQGW